MPTPTNKTHENRSQSASSAVTQKKGSGGPSFQFVDNRPEAIAQRKLREMADNSDQTKQFKVVQRIGNNSNVIQLNAEWVQFQKAVADGTVTIEVSAKHIKGNPKERRMVRSGGKRKPTGPFSNQSQDRVLRNAITAVKNGTARFVANTGTDFTIEVDSEHGSHGARKFNIHKGGGGENTRYIHQIFGDSSGYDTPENAEYSDSDSEAEDLVGSDVEDDYQVSEEEARHLLGSVYDDINE